MSYYHDSAYDRAQEFADMDAERHYYASAGAAAQADIEAEMERQHLEAEQKVNRPRLSGKEVQEVLGAHEEVGLDG